jgi:acetylornithine deacetylase
VNVATVHGGSAVNMIPDRCTLAVSYRPLPDSDPRAPYESMRARVVGCDRVDPGSGRAATVEIGEPFAVPAMLSPRGTPLEDALCAVLGPRPTGGAPFATDGCELARAGIQALICGPGELEQAHQPNESMPREVFERGPDVVAAVVRRLCTDARDDR